MYYSENLSNKILHLYRYILHCMSLYQSLHNYSIYLKHLRQGFIEVQFLWNFLQNALCQFVDNLIVGLTTSTAGHARLHLQDGAH